MTAPPVLLDARPTVEEVVRVARAAAPVAFAEAARRRLEEGRAVVERLARSDAAVYGLTTALGAGVDTRLSPDDVAAFQRRAVLARAVGVGAGFPRDVVRAVLFVRAAGLAAGGSGVSPAVAEAWVALLNAAVHPLMPRRGSVGAGDLAQLAAAALVLIGEGEAEFRGEILPGGEALARAGLPPAGLGVRDGHALVVHNAGSVGLGALVLADAQAALDALDVAAALSLEAFRGNLSPLDPRCLAARAAPGQREAAERLSMLLGGSALWEKGVARRVQDPLSFRCIAPVHGAARVALTLARAAVDAELGSASENPVLVAADGEMISNANFDATALALGFETLGQALAQAAVASAWRTIKLMSPASSGLPRFLSPLGTTRTGFATVQKTIASLEAEIRHLALPASLASIPTADGIEDTAPLTLRVVEKAGEIVERLRWLAAAELMVAAQGVELRGGVVLGPPLRRAAARVRQAVPALTEDRPTGVDIERLASLVAEGSLSGP